MQRDAGANVKVTKEVNSKPTKSVAFGLFLPTANGGRSYYNGTGEEIQWPVFCARSIQTEAVTMYQDEARRHPQDETVLAALTEFTLGKLKFANGQLYIVINGMKNQSELVVSAAYHLASCLIMTLQIQACLPPTVIDELPSDIAQKIRVHTAEFAHEVLPDVCKRFKEAVEASGSSGKLLATSICFALEPKITEYDADAAVKKILLGLRENLLLVPDAGTKPAPTPAAAKPF